MMRHDPTEAGAYQTPGRESHAIVIAAAPVVSPPKTFMIPCRTCGTRSLPERRAQRLGADGGGGVDSADYMVEVRRAADAAFADWAGSKPRERAIPAILSHVQSKRFDWEIKRIIRVKASPERNRKTLRFHVAGIGFAINDEGKDLSLTPA